MATQGVSKPFEGSPFKDENNCIYNIEYRLGKGAMGGVYVASVVFTPMLVSNVTKGKMVAIKVQEDDLAHRAEMDNEVKLLEREGSSLGKGNIQYQGKSFRFIVMNRFASTLRQELYIEQQRPNSTKVDMVKNPNLKAQDLNNMCMAFIRDYYAKQLLGIIYRDFKTDNGMFAQQGKYDHATLIDLGMSYLLADQMQAPLDPSQSWSSYMGSGVYIPPEIESQMKADKSKAKNSVLTDEFSFGMFLATIWSQHLIELKGGANADDIRQKMNDVLDPNSPAPNGISAELKNFIIRLTNPNPKQRPNEIGEAVNLSGLQIPEIIRIQQEGQKIIAGLKSNLETLKSANPDQLIIANQINPLTVTSLSKTDFIRLHEFINGYISKIVPKTSFLAKKNPDEVDLRKLLKDLETVKEILDNKSVNDTELNINLAITEIGKLNKEIARLMPKDKLFEYLIGSDPTAAVQFKMQEVLARESNPSMVHAELLLLHPRLPTDSSASTFVKNMVNALDFFCMNSSRTLQQKPSVVEQLSNELAILKPYLTEKPHQERNTQLSQSGTINRSRAPAVTASGPGAVLEQKLLMLNQLMNQNPVDNSSVKMTLSEIVTTLKEAKSKIKAITPDQDGKIDSFIQKTEKLQSAFLGLETIMDRKAYQSVRFQ